MKTIRFILIIFFGATFFSGCFLKSVHPLVSEENAILIDNLEGIWESEDQRWTFINDFTKFPEVMRAIDAEPDEDDSELQNAYFILFENLQDVNPDTAIFIGAATELNGSHFLDLYVFARSLEEIEQSESTFVDNHFFKVHTFSKISIDEDQLFIELFASSFIKELVSANRIRIKHEQTDDGTLITASTEELRKFVSKYADEEEAYEDKLSLTYRGYSIEK